MHALGLFSGLATDQLSYFLLKCLISFSLLQIESKRQIQSYDSSVFISVQIKAETRAHILDDPPGLPLRTLDAMVDTDVVSLRSCYAVFHFYSRGNTTVSVSSAFLLDKCHGSQSFPLPVMPWSAHSQGGEQMSAVSSCSDRRCFAESMEGNCRTEIKATSPGNKAMVISSCQWQLRKHRIKQELCVQGLLFWFSHCLFLALTSFSSAVPLLAVRCWHQSSAAKGAYYVP